MKIINNARINVFCDEAEIETITNALKGLFPFDLEKEKIPIRRNKATGFNEKKIIILEVYLDKDKHLNQFMSFLANKFSEKQIDLLNRQIESRLDEEFNFFIRLDRERLLKNDFFITDSGNCFHIKLNIACFPRKRENAIEVVKGLLNKKIYNNTKQTQ